MPIRKGDGTGIQSIRLGDGTQIKEVRRGDGTVVWTAGDDIPDSGLSHDYNALELSGSDGDSMSSFPDQAGSNDASANGGPTLRTGANGINGNQAVELDGVDDRFDANVASHNSGEYTLHVVYQLDSTASDQTVFSTGDSDGWFYNINASNNRSAVHAGIASEDDGAVTTNPEVVSFRFDGNNDLTSIRVNGTDESLSSSISSFDDASQNLGLGYRAEGTDRYMGGLLGRALVYEHRQSDSDFEATHDALQDEWGVA